MAARLLVESLALTLLVGAVFGIFSLFGEILLATDPDNWSDAGAGGSILRERFVPAFVAGFLAGASWGLLFGLAWGILREVWRKKSENR